MGALITVAGVMLTNRNNRASQERQLQAQLDQQREALEHDLRGEHQRRVLAARADLYADALEICESVDVFAKWVEAADDASMPEPDDGDLFEQVLKTLRDKRGRIAVFCPRDVREEVWRLSEVLEAFSQDWARLETLRPAAELLRQCVIEAAIADRTSGLAPEGLGGM